MGRVKMLIVLAFTVAGYHFDRARTFAVKNQSADPAEPALEDEYAPRDKSLPEAFRGEWHLPFGRMPRWS